MSFMYTIKWTKYLDLAPYLRMEHPRLFRVHKSTTSRLYERLRTTGITNDSESPRVTSLRQDMYIRLVHLLDRHRTPEESAIYMNGMQSNRTFGRTVRKHPWEFEIRARRKYVGLVLNQQRRQRRMTSYCLHMTRVT